MREGEEGESEGATGKGGERDAHRETDVITTKQTLYTQLQGYKGTSVPFKDLSLL